MSHQRMLNASHQSVSCGVSCAIKSGTLTENSSCHATAHWALICCTCHARGHPCSTKRQTQNAVRPWRCKHHTDNVSLRRIAGTPSLNICLAHASKPAACMPEPVKQSRPSCRWPCYYAASVMQRRMTPLYLKDASVSARQCSFWAGLQVSAITLMDLRTFSSSSFTSPAHW